MRVAAVMIALAGCGDNLHLGLADGGPPDLDAIELDGNSEMDASNATSDAAGPATRVTVSTYQGDVMPTPLAFVAAQDGSGPWFPLSSTDGIYTFDVASGRYGVGYTCLYGSRIVVWFRYDTPSAHSSFSVHCPPAPTTGTVSVDAKLGPNTWAEIDVGDSRCWAEPAYPTAVCGGVAVGTRDLVASIWNSSGMVGMGIIRGVTVTPGATTSLVLDAKKDTVPVMTNHVSLSGVLGTDSSNFANGSLITATGTAALLSPTLWPSSSTPVGAAPAQLLVASDLYRFSGSANGSFPFHTRTVDHYQHLPSDAAIELPPIIDGGAGANVTTPYVRAGAAFAAVSNAALYEAGIWQPTRAVDAIVTRAWAGAANPVTWLEPDLSGVAGWDSSWALAAGVDALWTATVTATDRDPLNGPDASWDGATVTTSSRFGYTTP